MSKNKNAIAIAIFLMLSMAASMMLVPSAWVIKAMYCAWKSVANPGKGIVVMSFAFQDLHGSTCTVFSSNWIGKPHSRVRAPRLRRGMCLVPNGIVEWGNNGTMGTDWSLSAGLAIKSRKISVPDHATEPKNSLFRPLSILIFQLSNPTLGLVSIFPGFEWSWDDTRCAEPARWP